LRLRTPKEQPTRRTRDEEPARQRRLNGKAIEPGADHGAGNRGAPRGARAHKQPDSASDARQHGERESFPTRSRLPSEPTPKCQKEKPVTLNAATNGRTNRRTSGAMMSRCPTRVHSRSEPWPNFVRVTADFCPAKTVSSLRRTACRSFSEP
jgi:hypothetical protein